MLFVNIGGLIFSQPACNCIENLTFLSNSVEDNYILFEEKIKDSSESVYNSFKQTQMDSALVNNHFYSCFQILRTYMRWFRDPHLTVSLRTSEKTKSIYRDYFSDFPIDLRRKKKMQGELSGIFVSEGYGYVVEIIKEKEKYIGTILKGDNVFWFEKQARFYINPSKKNYKTGKILSYRKDHILNTKPYDYSYADSVLTVVNFDVFKKIASIEDAKYVDFSFCENAQLKLLSDSTSYFYFPNFEMNQKVIIDSLLLHYQNEILKRPNLIIDLRNNTGGYSSCFNNLLPLIFDKPYQMPSLQFKASKENIIMHLNAYYRDSLNNKDYNRHKQFLMENVGKLVDINSVRLVVPDTVYKSPRRIVILTDKGVVSSGEHLVFYGKMSGKVVQMGNSTAGMFNTLDVLDIRRMPSDFFHFNCPTMRYCNIGKIDYVGFSTDIELNFDKYSSWVEIVKNYLETDEKKK